MWPEFIVIFKNDVSEDKIKETKEEVIAEGILYNSELFFKGAHHTLQVAQ